MSPENRTPISGLFEAHLTVRDLDRAVTFYAEVIGLPLAHFSPERRVAFFWIGASGRAMLGLWKTGALPIAISQHVAFEVSLADLHRAPARLKQAGIKARDFAGQLTARTCRAGLDADGFSLLPRSRWQPSGIHYYAPRMDPDPTWECFRGANGLIERRRTVVPYRKGDSLS